MPNINEIAKDLLKGMPAHWKRKKAITEFALYISSRYELVPKEEVKASCCFSCCIYHHEHANCSDVKNCFCPCHKPKEEVKECPHPKGKCRDCIIRELGNPQPPKPHIEPLEYDFDRNGLVKEVLNKINEVIAHINKQ